MNPATWLAVAGDSLAGAALALAAVAIAGYFKAASVIADLRERVAWLEGHGNGPQTPRDRAGAGVASVRPGR